MSNTAVIQLQQRETFETNVTRSMLAGLGAGLLAYLSQRFNVPVPLAFLSIVATTLACVRGDRFDKYLLMGLAVLLPALPWVFGFSQGWTVGLAGVASGLLMVKSRQAERGEEGAVAAVRPGPAHYVGAGLATGALSIAGMQVARILSARMTDVATPALLNFFISAAAISLFVAIGSLPAHVALKSDPVEARGEEVLAVVTGRFQDLTARALTLYRQCGESLAMLPREAAREELARTVQKLTRDSFELSAEWAGVESQLHDEASKDLERQIADLKKQVSTSRDVVARKQLELAADSLKEELDRLGDMKLKRERVLAKVTSQVALLERARVALIGMRSSHTSIRAAEMTAVARKLNALALSQADEARLAHEVATSAELSAIEANEPPRPSAPREVTAQQLAGNEPVDEQAAGHGEPENAAEKVH